MGSPCLIMRAAVLLTIVAVATGAPKFSKKALSTPLSRGGGRIVGGTEAYAGEFPHQIALLRGGVGGSLMCGGSLVKDNMVVTAGHCCDGQSASRLGVRVGNHHLYQDDPDQEDIAVAKVMLHEQYDSWTITNDICLLELESSADFSSSVIDKIMLPSDGEEYTAGTTCTVSGWGTTSEGGSLAKVLMKVDVPVVSDDDCRGSYGQDEIADSMICAGLDAVARTLAREILVVHSCAEASFPVWSLGVTGVLRLATQVFTLRHPTSSAGSTATCNGGIFL